ncbi:MAG: hypothetical protein AB1765_00755 [Candidatus Hydrogenedentota bacterium]
MKRVIIFILILLFSKYQVHAETNYKDEIKKLFKDIGFYLKNTEHKVIFTDGNFCVIDAGMNHAVFIGDEMNVYKKIKIRITDKEEEHLIPQGVIGIREIKELTSSGIRIQGEGVFEVGNVAVRKNKIKNLFLFSEDFEKDVFLNRVLLYLKGIIKVDGIEAEYKKEEIVDVNKVVTKYTKQYDRLVVLGVACKGESMDIGVEIYNLKDKFIIESKVVSIKRDKEIEFIYISSHQLGAMKWLLNYDLPRENARAVKLYDIDKDDIPECVVITDEEIIIYRIKNDIEPILISSRFKIPVPYQSVLFEICDIFFYDFEGCGRENMVITTNTSPDGSLIYKIQKESIEFSRKLETVVSKVKEDKIVSSHFKDFYYSSDTTYIITLDKTSGGFIIDNLKINEDYSDLDILDTAIKIVYIDREGYVKGLLDNNRVITLIENLIVGPKFEYDKEKYLYFTSNYPVGGDDILYQYEIKDNKFECINKIKSKDTIWDLSVFKKDKNEDYLLLLKGNRMGGDRIELWIVKK